MRTIKNSFLILFCLASFNYVVAQLPGKNTSPQEGIVTYAFKSNGVELKNSPPLQLFFKNNIAQLVQGNDPTKKDLQYIDFNTKETYQILQSKDGERYTLKTPFSQYEKAELTGETATILGYKCKKAKVFIRSNTIEIWFTNDLKIKGTPSLSIGPDLGLILKTVRNGNFETYATKVELKKVDNSLAVLPADLGTVVNEPTYKRKEIDNRFTTIPIFKQQQINFTDAIQNPSETNLENTTYRYASGTVVLKKVTLPDSENYTVFADLSQYSTGDAYDRTGSVFVIPMGREISFLDALRKGKQVLPIYTDKQGKEYQGVVETARYLPPLELMRFFTPFGVRAYNQRSQIAGYDWVDSVQYKQDITELLPAIKGDVWIGVYIGNYDGGGHTVNLDLNYYPKQNRREKTSNWVEPIFNTLNIMEMAGQTYATMFDGDSLTVHVNIPAGLKNLTMRYITTGHGGWGNGDEFNRKLNEIFMDGKKIFDFIPWRTDCATYRMYNPSSGKFGDGLSSSDLSRSNWCPGTTTNPVYIPINDLTPGPHTFKVAIPLGKTEGNSFSSWNISGTLIGEYK